MEAIKRNNVIIKCAIAVQLLIIILASRTDLKTLWGFDHLRFLPPSYGIAFLLISILVLLILLVPRLDRLANKLIIWTDSLLWNGSRVALAILSLSLTVLFLGFRIRAPLLGDSWTWLAIFGQGPSYILKWAEPGSILILRGIQSLQDGYTRETAMIAFQIMSIVSGIIFVYNLYFIIKMLCKTPSGRILSLSTILLSGATLLFFGYIEFYPVLWAAVSVLINLALRYLRNGRGLWKVIVIYIFCVIVHLEALILLPGIAYLITESPQSKSMKRLLWYIFGILAVIALSMLIWLLNSNIQFQVLLLPLFNGRPPAADYSVFSIVHLVDLVNLTFLIFPGILPLIAIWIFGGRKRLDTPASRFLAFMAAGSLFFLLFFGAAITMARDWDILSLSFLAPILLVLHQIDQSADNHVSRALLPYAVATGLVSACFFSTAISIKPAEDRYESLLNGRNEPGWVIFANYLLEKGDQAKYREIMARRSELFPNLLKLQSAYALLEKGQYENAMKISLRLVRDEPYNANYLQILGNLYGKFNQFDSAEIYYDKALSIQPYSSTLMNELGQLYLKEKKIEDAIVILTKAHSLSPRLTSITESLALAYINKSDYKHAVGLADTLFMSDSNSPGAHLIDLTVAMSNSDIPAAKYHYNEFFKYGKNRSDYNRVVGFYKYLGN